jgi:HEAT repeat protein
MRKILFHTLILFLVLGPIGYSETYTDYLEKRVDTLIKQLGSDDWQLREKSTDELIEIGAPAKQALTKNLNHPDVEVRERIKKILPLIQWKEVFSKRVNRFIAQLKSGKIEDVSLFQDVIGFISKDESVFILIDLLKDPNQPIPIKQQIVSSLGNIQNVNFKPVVNDLLELCQKEKDEHIRIGLIRTLARSGRDERTTSLCLFLLKEGSQTLKTMAINTLSEMGETSAVPEIIKVVKDADVNTKNTVLYALNRLRTEESTKELVRFMKEEPTNWLRAQATALLANYGDSKLIPDFLWVLKNEKDFDVVRNTLYALQQFRGDKTVSSAILDLLRTAPPPLQMNILASLQTLQERSVIPELIKMLEAENDYSNFNTILGSLQSLCGNQKFTPQTIPSGLKEEIIAKTKEWWEKNK